MLHPDSFKDFQKGESGLFVPNTNAQEQSNDERPQQPSRAMRRAIEKRAKRFMRNQKLGIKDK